jgi:hypothetical protein
MKRLAAATILLTALAVGAQAGGLPQATRLVNRMSSYHTTHYIRGQGKGQNWGLMPSGTAEARQEQKAKPAEPQKPGEKPKPAPQRAD